MTNQPKSLRPTMSCDNCTFRKIVERAPGSLLGKVWVWHTSVCPGWKKYVKTRWEHGEEPPQVGSWRGYWPDKKK